MEPQVQRRFFSKMMKIPAFPNIRIDRPRIIPSYNFLDDNGINLLQLLI